MRAARLAGLAVALAQLAARGDVASEVRAAADARNFALAAQKIQSYRAARGVTPELLEAMSWVARGALAAREFDRAESEAAETRKLAVELLRKRELDQEPRLPIALGAAIEVHAQVLAARGERAEAVAFLRRELAAYQETSIAPRIQKNINLLTLEGKPAPALDVSHWLGPKPAALAALKGHPVLLFFWAHWCGDCKAEVPILARLMERYGPRGLVLVGPTQLYGYVAGGVDAPPQQELSYTDQVRTRYYAALGAMPVPVSAENFRRYGCSTTPTLVLLDRGGVVRLYHPGAMTYAVLEESIGRVVGGG